RWAHATTTAALRRRRPCDRRRDRDRERLRDLDRRRSQGSRAFGHRSITQADTVTIAIAATVTTTAATTLNGRRRWDRSTVWFLLRNPAYMGQAAFGKTEAQPRGQRLRPRTAVPRHAKSGRRDKPTSAWISIPVPAIVTPAAFAAAQDQLRRNTQL